MHNKRFLGETIDIVNRPVKIYADSEKIYAVYNLPNLGEYITSEFIKTLKERPNDFLYTPLILFLDQV